MSHAEILPELRPWPEPVSTTTRKGDQRYYLCPDGVERVGVTNVLKALGMGSEALIGWAARTEKAAALEAVKGAFVWGQGMNPDSFIAEIERRMGEAKAYLRARDKAADMGQAVHQMIQYHLRGLAGLPPGDMPEMSSEASLVWSRWLKWWDDAGLKPIRIEQTVWDEGLGYAGTIDLLAENPAGQLELWDWKSSNYLAMKHHIQVAAYVKAARNWRPVVGAYIMRLPKQTSDLSIEVKPAGEMWDFDLRRAVYRNQDELFRGFQAALETYRLFMESTPNQTN